MFQVVCAVSNDASFSNDTLSCAFSSVTACSPLLGWAAWWMMRPQYQPARQKCPLFPKHRRISTTLMDFFTWTKNKYTDRDMIWLHTVEVSKKCCRLPSVLDTVCEACTIQNAEHQFIVFYLTATRTR